MKNKLLSLTLAAVFAAGCVGALAACGDDPGSKKPSNVNSGWEDLDGWEDDDDYTPPSFEPDIPSWTYSGEKIWIGAEESYYDGGDFEDYVENGSNRPILTNVNGATISFIVDVESDIDAWLFVTLAVNTGYGVVPVSDKFVLTVNGSEMDLTPHDGEQIKWLWQQADWWTNANYINVNFGQMHLKAGENRFDLSVTSEEVQLDCFILQPEA